MIPSPASAIARRSLVAVGCILSWVGALGPPALQADEAGPGPVLHPGERFVFTLRWGAFTVGEGSLSLSEAVQWEGQPAWILKHEARTNGFADRIYRVRNSVESWVAADLSRSLHYAKVQREGRSDREVEVRFDWEARTARYSNRGQWDEPVEIPPGTHDPLSIVLAARQLPLHPGVTYRIPVSDGRRFLEAVLHVAEVETITVPAGTFRAVPITVEVEHLGGVFRKSRNASILFWISQDARRLPLRMASKVAVGSFRADLASFLQPAALTAPPPPIPPGATPPAP